MQILTIVYEDPIYATTGFGRVALRLSEFFSQQGIDSNIICTSRRVAADQIDVGSANGVVIHRISVSNSPLSRMKFYQMAQTIVGKISKQSKKNVFLLNSAYTLPLSRNLHNRGLVVYYTFGTLLYELRSSISGILSPFNYRKLFTSSIDIAVETAFLSFVDVLLVPHDKAAEEFRRTYNVKKEKIQVVPYGQDIFHRYNDADFFADVDAFKNMFAPKKLLLFVGGADWHRKGAPYVLQAFNALKEHVPTTLVMTGNPTVAYLSLAKKLGLHVGKDVVLTGFVDDRTLAKLYAACDVFALPSLHEGFSQPVLEVMAYGKPVVASPLAAYPTVRNGVEGFTINPSDINKFVEALKTLMVDKETYNRISGNARIRAQQYSWERIGAKALSLFTELIQE